MLAGLMDAGASDAWLTPILMKKGLPGHTFSVPVSIDWVEALRDRVLPLVPTLGIRESVVGKTTSIRINLGHRGGTIVTGTPEHEDVARVAGEAGLPMRLVLDRAVATASAVGLAPGDEVPADVHPPE